MRPGLGSPRHRAAGHAIGAASILLVVYLSLAPQAPDAGRLAEVKLGHFLAYAWLMAWYTQLLAGPGTRLAVAAALVAAGVGLEYLQALTPHRTFGYGDMRDNAIGVAAGWLVGAAFCRWLRPRLEAWAEARHSRRRTSR